MHKNPPTITLQSTKVLLKELTTDMIGSPAIGDVQLLLSLKKTEVNSTGAFLRVWGSQRSRLDPVLRHQSGAN